MLQLLILLSLWLPHCIVESHKGLQLLRVEIVSGRVLHADLKLSLSR